MQIISDNKVLKRKFNKLISSATKISILSAWATNSNPLAGLLLENSAKLYKVVIGLKFYQTDPEFIKNYIRNKSVRFIKNDTSGVFHPKVYLFETDLEWHLFIGSANFTKQGFGINFEVTTYNHSDDFEDDSFLSIQNIIDKKWSEATRMTKKDLEEYSAIYKIQKRKLDSLSGSYGSKNKRKPEPIFNVPILNMSWGEFVKDVRKNDTGKYLPDRIKLLNVVRKYFSEHKSLINMTLNQRGEIGGLKSENGLIYGSFGSMKARGNYKSYLANPDKLIELQKISEALDKIPLFGVVKKTDYMNFIEIFDSTFTDKEMAGATRLLTMKRPDVFVNFNNKNKKALCEAFKISTNISFEEYWDLIIERIQDAVWWNNPTPKNKEERSIENKRTAFLDVIFYED